METVTCPRGQQVEGRVVALAAFCGPDVSSNPLVEALTPRGVVFGGGNVGSLRTNEPASAHGRE